MDLSCSITDGRFREQRSRLLEKVNGDSSKIVYIIETSNLSKLNKMYPSYRGALVNLIMFHNIRVVYTKDVQDTYETVMSLVKKLSEGEIGTIHTQNYGGLITKRQKKTDNIVINQLTCIVGVSLKIATSIKDKYNLTCINQLCELLKADPDILVKDTLVKSKLSSNIHKALITK